jgi:Protein of unknown function (DUF1214)
MTDSAVPEVVAWRNLCRRFEALGERMLGDEFPGAPEDRPEGFAHLAEQVVCWLTWALGHADPRRPTFQRQNDLFTQWGGPNADNVYRHARVETGNRYRIIGRMHSCDDFILAIRAGYMHMEQWGTLAQVTASELGIGPGSDFELLLGGAGDPGWIPLPEGAVMASIREYYFDWQPREPATFTIECLDVAAPPEPLTAARFAAQLDEAAALTEHSLVYWNRYLRDARAERNDNSFAPSLTVAKGLSAARYAYCFYDLAPDEALVVDSDVPDARYWSLQLYTHGWFELIDTADRVTSINHAQAAISADGRLRVVVAHEDPGVANWLDTGGRRAALLMFRWFWPEGEPAPTATVVKFDELSALLAGESAVDAMERAEEVRRRREHLAWRFRS